jgi:hypothetical protein
MFRALLPGSLLLLSACGAATGNVPPASAGQRSGVAAAGEQQQGPVSAPQPEPAAASGEGAAAGGGEGAAAGGGEGAAAGGGDASTDAAGGEKAGDVPVIVQAGTMPRDSLVEVLDLGVARFLQHLDTRPLKAQGRFVGWKLLAFFPGDERFSGGAVRAGDTVLRVNGRSIERPESFKTVWDSLYELRYVIEHGAAAAGGGKGKP